MKVINAASMWAVILLGGLASGSALAGHGHSHSHGHFSVFLSAPLFGPWYYPPSYYYPPAVVVPPRVYVESSPPVYIERGEEQATEAPGYSRYWYYCSRSRAYYPYVKSCPEGWERVRPEPPPG